RSTTEKLICGDEELARMDRELGGLHHRAKQAAADPRAFQRNSDAEWQRRENTCRDAECLRRWYAQRRQDLSTAAAAPSQPRVEASRPAEPRVAERRTHVAEPVARAATTPRPRPQLRQEPSEVMIAPGVASGDSGLSEPPAARWRPARQADSRGAPSAEGSPNTVE
ncbi:MAG: hypothetical protein JWP41_197, partial [Ramlibacter sp.]|nr:hypothetical protein [Ramlibacter sp.]